MSIPAPRAPWPDCGLFVEDSEVSHDETGRRSSKADAGRELDGREWNEFPQGSPGVQG